MEKWMKNGTFGEKRWKNGRKNGRKTALFFTKIQSPVSGVEKWGKIEVSGGLRKIGDFIGLPKEKCGCPLGKHRRGAFKGTQPSLLL